MEIVLSNRRRRIWRAAVVCVLMLTGDVVIAQSTVTHKFAPEANPKAIVTEGNARFTVLTPRMVRMEYAPDGRFEDRASHVFIHRRQRVPQFTSGREGDELTIETSALTLRYRDTPAGFAPDTLSIEGQFAGKAFEWRPGVVNDSNLGGTARTLDQVSGSIPVEAGLLTRAGWTLIDDTESLLFDDSDWPWVTTREAPDGYRDWYYLAYGNNYIKGLQDFTAVAGKVPLPPRYVFGAWWSRYWYYSAGDFKRLVGEFREHDVPLDVLVVDMDWHLDGWTGYTWNPKYFPDPEGFLDWTAEQGLRVPLNLHPHDGVGKHEAAFEQVARAVGKDPRKVDRIPFQPTDKDFVEAYFKYLHHPLEEQGVDFWWMDWQQGEHTAVPGLDPLWWLNYLHWMDWELRPGAKAERPVIFSRWGGLGNHRYPIGFSGDTFCNWPSLAFQPYFTATAGNVGFGYWSHDIGGHQPGPVEPELYTRWVQFGALSPVLRTHTTKNPRAERRIWEFPPAYFEAMRDAWYLRYELLPYIYTAARQCYDTCAPLCRPLYYHWPEEDAAYENTHEYLFGDDLLVAPVTHPSDDTTGVASQRLWLPPGMWRNWYTGVTYQGGEEIEIPVPLDEIPLFVRVGAVIPTTSVGRNTGNGFVSNLVLKVFPGDAGEGQLYEDAAVDQGYLRDEHALTEFRFAEWLSDEEESQHIAELQIEPTAGAFPGMPETRTITVHYMDAMKPAEVQIDGKQARQLANGAAPSDVGWRYDAGAATLIVQLGPCDIRSGHRIAAAFEENTDYEYALTFGLRGQLAILQEATELLGGETPAEIEDYLRHVERIRASGGDFEEHMVGVDPLSLAMPIMKSDKLGDVVKRGLVVRLLGLSHGFDVQPGDDEAQLAARASVAVEPLVSNLHATTRRLRFMPVEGWQALGFEASVDPHEALHAAVELDGDGLLQTGELRSELVLTGQAGRRLHFPFHTTLFPSINAWWIIGPLRIEDMRTFDKQFSTGRIDFDREHTGKSGEPVPWRAWRRTLSHDLPPEEEFFVRFEKVFGELYHDAVAYAVTYLRSPKKMDAQLAIGSDDGVLVWLNGKKVHMNLIGRPYQSRQDIVPITLQAGVNRLVVRVDQGGGDWGFGVHVESRDGRPLPEVRVLESLPQ